MKTIVWLLPVLFILHDMEEIMFAIKWKSKEMDRKTYVKLPFVPFGNLKSTEAFTVGVYEELLILVIASAIGFYTDHYEVWLGLLAANILHLLLMHIIGIPLAYRRYVPGVVTALLTIIPCCMVFYTAVTMLQYSTVRLSASILGGMVVAIVNLKILHQCGGIFDRGLSYIHENI